MAANINGQSLIFNNRPGILGYGIIAGPAEGKGLLGNKFDLIYEDARCGEKTWELGEMKMVKKAIDYSLSRANVDRNDINILLGGDLLNQIIVSNFTARSFSIPFLGLYGACSTFIEVLLVGSLLVDGKYADKILGYSSSHYQTAERQFRTPLEYGDQYPPTKQWTITGAGAYVMAENGGEVVITHATIGKVIDLGVNDSNDMGSAMAPAAADTILQHFSDLQRGPQDYDLIITGDLGRVGRDVLNTLLQEKNCDISEKLKDCGAIILNDEKKYGSGGSGCAASALGIGSVFIPELIAGNINRILVVGTGALMSPLTLNQNETIPAIAHAVVIERS